MKNLTSKAETFIGFALKSGKYKLGANTIETLKKAKLIIVCDSASENSKNDAVKFSKKFQCPILKTEGKTLAELTHKSNVKMMAITDNNLAKAIIENKENVLSLM